MAGFNRVIPDVGMAPHSGKASGNLSTMIDLWEHLRPIFNVDDLQGQPEIVIVNLRPDDMRYLLQYLMEHSRQLDARFTDFYENVIFALSKDEIIDRVVRGDLVGVLMMSLLFEDFRLPSMAFFIEDKDFITITYEIGPEWLPVTIVAFFEFLRMVHSVSPDAIIGLNPYQFDRTVRKLFDVSLKTYLKERYEPPT